MSYNDVINQILGTSIAFYGADLLTIANSEGSATYTVDDKDPINFVVPFALQKVVVSFIKILSKLSNCLPDNTIS